MVAVAILGIVAAFALPSMGGFLAGSRVEATAGEFARALQAARSEALARSRPTVACPSDAPFAAAPACAAVPWERGWIVYADETGGPGPDANDPVMLQNGPGEPGASYGPGPTVAVRVRFDDTGAHVLDTGAPVAGAFRIEVGGEGRDVRVAASGRVTVSTPGAGS